jgi:hypothetical protein
MQLSKIAILLILALWVTDSLADDRTELHLFQYGRTNTDEFKMAFFDFRDVLTEKLPKLSAEVSRNFNIPAVSQLRLRQIVDENGELLRPEERVGSLYDKRQYWRQTGALSVLTGHLRQQEDIIYVYTTFFWGDLKGPYNDEMITLKLPVEGEFLDSTSDSHSVAILYALAHDTKKECTNSAETIYLLNQAQQRAKAISRDLPELSAELEAIVKSAIDEIRSECSE